MVSQMGYRKRLAEASADDPGLEFYATRERGEWTSRLDLLGLDAELFRYQREMNAGEGEAAGAFTFTSDEAFVDFLLRAVIAEDDPREIADLVGQYTKSLAERESLTVEREFVEQALERLQPLHDAHTAHELAVKAATIAGTAYTELAHGLSARSRVEHQRHAICIATAKTAADRNKAAEDNAQLRRAATLELERLVGQFRLRAAEASKKDADRESKTADLDANAWRETDTVADLRLATSAADEVARIIQEAEESARPTLERKNETAAALAGGLLAFADRAAAEADDAASKAEHCTGRAETADNERAQHERDSAKAQAQADTAAAQMTDIDARIAAAITSGVMPAGLDAVTAAEQAVTLTNEYREQLSLAEDEASDLDEELDEARQQRNRAENDVKGADGELRAEREVLAAATARTDDLAMRTRLAELLDTDAIILATDADALADALATSIRDLETLRARLQAEAAAGEHVRAALESGGLLPPPPEVTIACEALNAGGITSWTGWDYLTQVEDVDRRRQMLEAAPHLATGIVLNDPEQLAEAAELLTARELFPAYFLAVGPSDALLTIGPPPFGLVVPPNPALYDPDAAATARAALQQRDEERRHQLDAVAAAHRADVELLRELNAWRADFRQDGWPTSNSGASSWPSRP